MKMSDASLESMKYLAFIYVTLGIVGLLMPILLPSLFVVDLNYLLFLVFVFFGSLVFSIRYLQLRKGKSTQEK
jgi:hypothetical protein